MYNMYDRFLAIRSGTITKDAQKEVLCSEAPVARANGRPLTNRRRPSASKYNNEEDLFDSGREATGCITTYDSVKLAIVWVALQKRGETKLRDFWL
jgi:hypothetical protein